MMRANELMVGDWVRITDPDKYEGAECRILSTDNREGAYYRVFVDDGAKYGCLEYEVFKEDIAPISITPEILEKNGFIKVRNYIWEIRTKDTCIKYEWHEKIMLEITHKLSGKDERGKCNIASLTFGWIDDMCVHELQHAIRLCKIEKDIVL